jgi:hypothetical protein
VARVVGRGPFSGPAESEGVVAPRLTRDYSVPPDIWRRQRFLANGFGFRLRLGSGLLVLHGNTTVILVL